MKTIVMDSANKYLVVALYENQKCFKRGFKKYYFKELIICLKVKKVYEVV